MHGVSAYENNHKPEKKKDLRAILGDAEMGTKVLNTIDKEVLSNKLATVGGNLKELYIPLNS